MSSLKRDIFQSELGNIFKNIQLALKNKKFNLSDEKLLQKDIALAFDESNIDYKKEVRLDNKNIVDFMIDNLAIEIKIQTKASKMSIYRQLERYSQYDEVHAILLITSKTIPFPNEINEKEIFVLSLSRTQL